MIQVYGPENVMSAAMKGLAYPSPYPYPAHDRLITVSAPLACSLSPPQRSESVRTVGT